MIWQALGAVGGLITAIVALFLLAQGQHDRRTIWQAQREAQARDVLVRFDPTWHQEGPNAESLAGLRLVVSNQSDRPVTVRDVVLIRPTTNATRLPVILPKTEDLVVAGRTDLTIELAKEWHHSIGIATFLDHRGEGWQRRTETQQLAPSRSSYRAGSDGRSGPCCTGSSCVPGKRQRSAQRRSMARIGCLWVCVWRASWLVTGSLSNLTRGSAAR